MIIISRYFHGDRCSLNTRLTHSPRNPKWYVMSLGALLVNNRFDVVPVHSLVDVWWELRVFWCHIPAWHPPGWMKNIMSTTEGEISSWECSGGNGVPQEERRRTQIPEWVSLTTFFNTYDTEYRWRDKRKNRIGVFESGYDTGKQRVKTSTSKTKTGSGRLQKSGCDTRGLHHHVVLLSADPEGTLWAHVEKKKIHGLWDSAFG